MLKIALVALLSSTAATALTFAFVGRTVHSSPFQMDIPYGAAIKVAQDPANVWSWHYDFQGVGGGSQQTADVLVDVDGNNVMDTEHAWLRVIVTDLEIVNPSNQAAIATISDGVGKRYSAGCGGGTGTGGSHGVIQHIALSTPIVLPVGSSLRVTLQSVWSGAGTGDYEVNLIGRVVNL